MNVLVPAPAYQLQTPVYLQGRTKPIGYLTDVEHGVRRALGGDPSYSGFLTRNPVHPDWETQATGYAVTLEDLAAEVDLSAGPEPVSGIGRNVELFTACRKHAVPCISQVPGPGRSRFRRLAGVLHAVGGHLDNGTPRVSPRSRGGGVYRSQRRPLDMGEVLTGGVLCAPGGARTQGWGQAEARVDPMQRFHGRNERAGAAVDC